MSFSPDGKYLAVGKRLENVINIWDVEKPTEVKILKGHAGGIRALAFSPDGKFLASGSDDATLCLWKVENLEKEKTLKGSGWAIEALAYSPDGKYLAYGGFGTVYLCPTDELEKCKLLNLDKKTVNSLAFGQYRFLASGGDDYLFAYGI